jgi:1-deoxy-D-xylulose-5-phosphate synthase
MVILAPRDENDLQHCLRTAIECGGPAAVRFPRGAGYGVAIEQEARAYPVGTAELLRDGEDVLLLPLGTLVGPALDAARQLARVGVSAAVINPRFVKPLDRTLIADAARRTGRVVTIEEHMLAGGFGAAVLELFADVGLTGVQVARLGIPDVLVEQGTQTAMRARFGLTAEGIQAAAEGLLGMRSLECHRSEGAA